MIKEMNDMDNKIDTNNLNNYSIGINLFKWLLSNLKKGSTILEFGSGYGSLENGLISLKMLITFMLLLILRLSFMKARFSH